MSDAHQGKDRNLFKDLLWARRDVQDAQRTGDVWTNDELSIDRYNKCFSKVLGHSIEQEVANLQKLHPQVKAANILGGLTALRSLDISSGHAVRLMDKRTPDQKRSDDKKGLHVISGDLQSKRTLVQIPNNLHLILSMGEGAQTTLPLEPDFYYFLGSTLLDKLASGGVALLQVPSVLRPMFHSYFKEHTTIPGIKYKFEPQGDPHDMYDVLLLRKLTPQARLPRAIFFK